MDIRVTSTAQRLDSTDRIEDFIIIWLDANMENNQQILFKRHFSLQNFNSFVRTFIDSNLCIEYIMEVQEEQIFFIVSGSLGQSIVPMIHDLTQILKIYVFCTNTTVHSQWVKSFQKIRGVFSDEDPLLQLLSKDLKVHSNAFIPMSISNNQQQSLQDLDDEQVEFLWFQLLIEAIYRLPKTSASKERMLKECCSNFIDNSGQLNMINEFFDQYNPDSAINWYTKSSFVYQLLNKALRTLNIDLIFNYHYFLTDLFKQLTKLYDQQFKGQTGILTTFRGQFLHRKELEKLQNSKSRLVSINTFFSSSISSEVAVEFCGNGEQQSQGIESVMFQINIDLSVYRRPFAKIDQLSSNSDEQEILFALGSVFRIEEVELYTDYIWLVTLTLTNSVKTEVDDLLQHFTRNIGPQPTILELGVLLSTIGDFERAKRFYNYLLAELPPDHVDIGILYNNLGEIYRKEGRCEDALSYYRKAVEELAVSVGFLDDWFAIVYSNMGLIFYMLNDYKQSLSYFRAALFILEHFDSPEKETFANIYNGMAAVYQSTGKQKLALNLYLKELKIETEILPCGHPSLGTTYTNIALSYSQAGNYPLALDHYKKGLVILQKILPNNHHELAVIFLCIGETYKKMDKLDDGLPYFSKAQQTIESSPLPSFHEVRKKINERLIEASDDGGHLEKSIEAHEKLLQVLAARVPIPHREILFHAHNLARLMFKTGDHQSTMKYLQKALDSIQELPYDENIKSTYYKIANGFQYVNQPNITIEHFKRILSQETDPRSILAAEIHNHLGIIYDRVKDDRMALEHYRMALNIYMDWPDSRSNEISTSHFNVAIIENSLGQYDQAIMHLEDALHILTLENSTIRSKICTLLVESYVKSDNRLRGKEYFRDSIERAVPNVGREHPMIQTYQASLQLLSDSTEES